MSLCPALQPFSRILLLTVATACCTITPAAHAAQWFLISGNPDDPKVDSAELDISTVGKRSDVQSFELRFALASPREDLDGYSYQSYISTITVICSASGIYHDAQTRYASRHWSGDIQKELFVRPKPMAFSGLNPDPRRRLMAAACSPRL